jgi:hypothetical protein
LHGTMWYDIIDFTLEHGALPRGVMQDHGTLPQGPYNTTMAHWRW